MTYVKHTRGKGKQLTAPSPPPTTMMVTKSPQPATHPQSLINKKKLGPRPLPAALAMTEYVVILDHTALIPPTRCLSDVSTYVRQAQASLKAAQADINLLAGRWSAPGLGCRNFIFTFEGKLNVNNISKYNSILFADLGPNCCSIPNEGFATVMFYGVPCFHDDDGYFPSPSALEAELMKNPVCKGHKTLAPLRWLGSPACYTANGGHSGSIV
jgi:hypothetical protein